MKSMKSHSATYRLHALLFALVLAFDQITKIWARARFSLANGEPNYADSIPVLGDWFHLRLVYNYGAAFGMKPHAILPFLHPMLFYIVFSLAAIVLLSFYYRRLGADEPSARLGIVFILAGAVGNNLIDRLAMNRVTDFIDVGIPGFSPRWPVFNIADSAVCIGIALLILPSFFVRRRPESPAVAPQAEEPSETSPHET